jgi:hypothetical protein
MRSIEELSETIIGVLGEQDGFDAWWYSVEDYLQEEILEDIQNTVQDWLEQ